MSTPGPHVSALIATRDRPELLRRCLDHLRRQTGCRLEIVVVDDHSNYDVAGLIAGYADALTVRLLRLDRPAGYIVARNHGIRACSAEVIVQLDDDSWLIEDDAAAVLATYLLSDPGLGALAVKTYFPCAQLPGGIGFAYPRWDRPHGSVEFGFQGCAAVLRQSVAVAAGLYPEHFVYYGEEDYLAMQMLRLGQRIELFARRGVVHGQEVAATPDNRAESHRRQKRIRASMLRNMPLLYLENLPVPLNGLLGGLAFLRRAAVDPALAWPAAREIVRLRLGTGRARPRRLSWRQALAYFRLRRAVTRGLRGPEDLPINAAGP